MGLLPDKGSAQVSTRGMHTSLSVCWTINSRGAREVNHIFSGSLSSESEERWLPTWAAEDDERDEPRTLHSVITRLLCRNTKHALICSTGELRGHSAVILSTSETPLLSNHARTDKAWNAASENSSQRFTSTSGYIRLFSHRRRRMYQILLGNFTKLAHDREIERKKSELNFLSFQLEQNWCAVCLLINKTKNKMQKHLLYSWRNV